MPSTPCVRILAVAVLAAAYSCKDVTPPASVGAVSIEPQTMVLLIGQSRQLTAITKDAHNTTLTGRALAWSSSDTTKATISVSGLLTAVAAGSATITATSEGISGTASVTVSLVPVSSVTVTPAARTLYAGETLQLTALTLDSAGGTLSGREVTWSSSDTTRATVSDNGLVTTLADGSVNITATVEGKSATATITVLQVLTDVSIDFCSDNIPVFFAYRSQSGAWTQVTGDAAGTFTFRSTRVLSIVMVGESIRFTARAPGYIRTFDTTLLFVTLDDIRPLLETCREGSKDVNVTIGDVPTGSHPAVSLGTAQLSMIPPYDGYVLRRVAEGPLDLVATLVSNTTSLPERILIRRRQDLANGSTVSVDLGSTEARGIVTHTLTANEPVNYRHTFRTVTTQHSLCGVCPTQAAANIVTLMSVPADMTENGDVHSVEAFAAQRTEWQYHQFPGDRHVTFGPPLASPTTIVVPHSSPAQLRTELPWQDEYGSFVVIDYSQGDPNPNPDTRFLRVRQTVGYTRAPGTSWVVSVPNLPSVPGFPTDAAFEPGKEVLILVSGYHGSFPAYLGAPRDGDVLRRAVEIQTRMLP